jgi:hypothetical protein
MDQVALIAAYTRSRPPLSQSGAYPITSQRWRMSTGPEAERDTLSEAI